MSIFGFAPKLTTITATFTPPGNGPVTFTFTENPETTAGFNLFPVPPFLSSIPDNAGCAPDDQLPGPIETLCSTGTGAPPTTNTLSKPPPLPPPHSTPESTVLTSSQSSGESTSTPTSADPTQGGSITATTASYSSSASAISAVSSDLGLPVTSLSTASNPFPTPTQPSAAPVTQSSKLSAGSAIGIALGVFAGASILVAAALFLFLRERKRRRGGDSMTRKLTSSEGSPSRVLISTWLRFGSLAVGSEPDPIPEHKSGREASLRPHDVPFHAVASGKTALPDPATPPVYEVAHAPSPPLGHESSEGTAAHLLALAATEYSASGLPLRSTLAGARAEDASERSERGRGGDDIEAQGARDPFADPHLSGISHASMSARSGEVESVEAQ